MRIQSASLFSVALLVCASVFPAEDGNAFFTEHIEPILKKNCYECHSHAGKMKGGLTLDSRSGWAQGGESGPALIPNDPEKSRLVLAVRHTDADLRMPPKMKLPDADIALLVDWVKRGAPDPRVTNPGPSADWWSLKPLVKPAVPGSRSSNPIDAFVRAKLAEKSLKSSPEADRRTLIRRLYFDLIGLPPTPEESDAFVNDMDPAAYENLVDKLLASPRYGERWARHWLDAAHFGETHGYDKDKPRPNAWPYRDYVIRAFNDDKPYDRFAREQIAGDALYPNSRDGIEALGFLAAGPWDFIGHEELPETKIDGKIARHLDRDDMVAATINTFCSLTVHCAQCHNHKFDPIKQEDYYSLHAVFSALDRADKKYDVDTEVARKRMPLDARLREIESRGKEIDARIKAAAGVELEKIDKTIAAAEKAASQGRRPEYGWHSAISKNQEEKKWVQVDLGKTAAMERVVLAPCNDDFNGIGAGFGFPVRYRIEASDDSEFKGTPLVIAARDLVDESNPGTLPQTYSAEGKTARYLRVTATKLAPRQNDFIFALAELQVFDANGKNIGEKAAVSALDSIEAPVRWLAKNLTDGIYPAATGGDADFAKLRADRATLLAKNVPAEVMRERDENAAALKKTRDELNALPPPKYVYAGTVHTGSGSFTGTGASGGKPRPIFLLARGDVKKPLQECGPGALMCVPGLKARFEIPSDAPESARRAALAEWLSARENALFWRSIVNRIWQHHFGRAIVDTPNDFGRMGTPPTQPELLDWLALEFRDRMGGSMKKLHHLIVTSETYKQASASNTDAAKIDSDNRWLWRMNRRKLESEAVRDSILFAAEKLNLTMGGPSFQDFVIKQPEHSPHYHYELSDPDDTRFHRRAVYRFVVRSQREPFMTALDSADPSLLVDKRLETITPLQALALLNNQLVVAMSKHFAARVERESKPIAALQAERIFRIALSRPPNTDEVFELSQYIRKHGLENACRLVLNLNEFLFVD